MARRELVDGFVNGRIGEKEFVTRLIATGMTLAAAVAFALALVGNAQSATQAQAKQARPAAVIAVCATGADFYGNMIEIVRCPAFLAAVGEVPLFNYVVTVGGAASWNLDFREVSGISIWKTASAGVFVNGLAPGQHTIRYRTPGFFGDVVAEYSWITPGAAPENIVVSNFGPSNSKALITWTSQIPAWRTYCSVNGGVERICRQPAGLSLNGLPSGVNTITIRATNGPADFGRTASISFDRADPVASLSVNVEGPWGFLPAD